MALDVKAYAGREQAYVKHYFLENYLERLIHKTASRFDHIAYVDGFSGPWQNSGEDYADTSFGIALSALRKARSSWKTQGREVAMSAHLVEQSKSAFTELQTIPSKYPDVTVIPYHRDFIKAVPEILANVPDNAFAFVFIDPKGWALPLSALAPLLKRPNTEIVFNFMFDFINRAASMSDPTLATSLNELLPDGDWRAELAKLKATEILAEGAAARKAILVDAFTKALSKAGNYEYVLETPVLRPLKDRTLYSLFYGTRRTPGVEVFRDCQVKTLQAQQAIRGTAKMASQVQVSGQGEMFDSLSDLAPDDTVKFLAEQRAAAQVEMMTLIPLAPASIEYGRVWPQVLAKYAIRKTELSSIVGSLRKGGELEIPQWVPRKRIPEDNYRINRHPSSTPR
ncbi:three-Cys-motif partner protein TcmP [soil metagenome]